jgi:hypothetical protein
MFPFVNDHAGSFLLDEGASNQQPPGGLNEGDNNSQFTSIIQIVGGDPVGSFPR